MLGRGPAQTSELDAALARVDELGTTLSTTEAKLGATKAALAKVTQERNALRRVYQLLLEQHELLRRRIYMPSAERIDVTSWSSNSRRTPRRSPKSAPHLPMPTRQTSPPAAGVAGGGSG